MKSLLHLFLSLSLTVIAPAQELEATSQQSNQDQIMEKLLNAPDSDALEKAITQGRKAGLPEQMFLEARFVYLVNQNHPASLAALAPALEKQLPAFSPDNTLIFAVREDFESIVHYTKALGALQKQNTALFKKHITEAFWLSPDHASQFAPHIKALRMKEAMARLTLDLKRPFEDQKNKKSPTTLASIKGDAPALLIHFWSPWVQQSLLAMPEITTIAQTLIAQNIPVASFLLNGSPESRTDADTYLSTEGRANVGAWLIDTPKQSLASILRVSSFPTVILVNKDGKILFNGDPADLNLWTQFALINPQIKQPKKDLVLPEPSLKEESPLPERKE